MKTNFTKLSARGRALQSTLAIPAWSVPRTLLLCTALGCFFWSSPAPGQVTYTPVTHSAFQAVYDDGTSAWPANGAPYPIQLTGVVINNPSDMLDYSNTAADPQWQVYIQATAPNDFGGTALYMRKLIPWNPSQNDTDAQWTTVMNSLNYPLNLSGQQVTTPLQYGDVIQVDAKAPGLFYDGQYNVNDQHVNQDPSLGFSITILQRGTTPAAAPITLATLKDPHNNFIFDPTRQTGDEHYQGSLVQLNNLLLADPADWGLGNTVTVEQGNLTFPMTLGLDPALSSINPFSLQTSPFNVTAILAQDSSTDFTSGYYLWATNASEFSTVPEPGSLALLATGGLAGLLIWRRRRRQAS